MVRIIVVLAILISNSVMVQFDKKLEIKSSVDIFFEGFYKGYTILMKSAMHDGLLIQTTYKNKERMYVLITEEPTIIINVIANRASD